MKHEKWLLLATSCAAAAFSGSAAPLVLSGTGHSLEVRPDLPGGDQYPFVGLQAGVQSLLAFEFFYDSATAPTTLTDTFARYVFPGNGSTFVLDGRSVEATSLEIAITHTFSGDTLVDVTMRSSLHEMSANVGFYGSGFLPLTVPTSFNPFAFPVEIGANSDLNTFLVPVVMGTADTIAITPAPGAAGLLGAVVLGLRRRR